MSQSNVKHTLLATLGGQPQIVTFTLDLLLQRGIPISEVIVIHPAIYENMDRTIECLSKEFLDDRYRHSGETIHFRRHVLRQYGKLINDITDTESANGTLETIHELVYDLKQQQHCIHFSITGGRRLMGWLAFSAALLNFDQRDHLWHIHTPQETKQRAYNGAIMHVLPDDDVHLIEVPFARAAQPILARMISNATSATSIINTEQEQLRQTNEQHCKNLIQKITPAQKLVLQAFARGLTPQQAAEELCLSIKTINSHTSNLLHEYRNEWNIASDKRINYNFLYNAFSAFFTTSNT